MNARLNSAPLDNEPPPTSHSIRRSEPAALTIDHRGIICDCNDAAASLFGFSHCELCSCHVSRVLPQLTEVEWMQKGQPNHHLSYLTHIGHRFAAVTRDGYEFPSKLFLNDLSNSKVTRLLLIVRSLEQTETA